MATSPDGSDRGPVSPVTPPDQRWRATARPVAPQAKHRPQRFDPLADTATQPPVPSRQGMFGRLGNRLSEVADGRGDRRYRDRDRGSRPASGGRGWVVLAVLLAFACWLVWLAFDLIELGSPGEPLRGLPFAAVAAVVVYWLTRLAGHLVRVTWDLGPRRSNTVPNLVTAVFTVLCGVAFLSRTPLALGPLWADLWSAF